MENQTITISQTISFERLDIDFDDFIKILAALEIPYSWGTLYDDDESECGRWIEIYRCSLAEYH